MPIPARSINRVPYSYVSHPSNTTQYSSRLSDLLGEVASQSFSLWSRVVQTYATNYVLGVLTHTVAGRDIQLAFVVGISPDGIHENNLSSKLAGHTTVTDNLYVAMKPANGLSFNLLTNPLTDPDWCSNAGAFGFQRVIPQDMSIASYYQFIFETGTSTYPNLVMEYQDLAGGGNPTTALVAVSSKDEGFYGTEVYATEDGDESLMFTFNREDANAFNYHEDVPRYGTIITRDGSIDELFHFAGNPASTNNGSVGAIDYADIEGDTGPGFNNGEIAVSSPALGRKGVLGRSMGTYYYFGLSYLPSAADTVGKQIFTDGTDYYLHIEDGFCIRWNNSWGVV